MKFLWSITECFAIIIIGYFCGKIGLISNLESKGIAKFVSNFALPALVFRQLATIDFADIKWSLIAGIFIAKVILFIAVSLVTLVISSDSGKAGLFGIFCTQSNDFAVGYPLLESLYSRSRVNYASYMYILAPVQLLMINPFGLSMMELQKCWNRVRNLGDGVDNSSRKYLILDVCKGVLTNPIVLMTIIGIIWNIAFQRSVPDALDSIVESLSKAFGSTALFLLGLNLVGNTDFIHRSNTLYLPMILVIAKLIILPFILRVVVQLLEKGPPENNLDATNFAFLYGMIPTAPTAFVFALQYDMETAVVSMGMALSTIAAGPFMYVTASLMKLLDSSVKHYLDDLGNVIVISSIISFVLVTWMLLNFLFRRRWRSVIHRCTILLLVSQLIVAIGGVLSIFIKPHEESPAIINHFRYMLIVFGLLATRIWLTMLSVILALLYVKGLNFIRYVQRYIFGAAAVSLALSVLSVFLVSTISRSSTTISPAHKCEPIETWMSIISLSISTIITTSSLIVCHYFDVRTPWIDRSLHRVNSGVEDTIDADISLSNHHLEHTSVQCCNNEQSPLLMQSSQTLDANSHLEVKKHLVLLIVANTSMFISLMVCVDELEGLNGGDTKNGIFVELQYVCAILNYGQGLLTFFIFGSNLNLFKKMTLRFRSNR